MSDEPEATSAKQPRVSIIVAYSTNRVIGKDGTIPWHLSDDLKRFKQLTMGHHIVMGRKTWESIGRILPGRHHVIISRKPDYSVPGAVVVDSIKSALEAAGNDAEVFVIGGADIFRLALPFVDRILATEIDKEFAGDTRFQELDAGEWAVTAREDRQDPATGLAYRYVTLERRK